MRLIPTTHARFGHWLRDAAELVLQRGMPQPAEDVARFAWDAGQSPAAFVDALARGRLS